MMQGRLFMSRPVAAALERLETRLWNTAVLYVDQWTACDLDPRWSGVVDSNHAIDDRSRRMVRSTARGRESGREPIRVMRDPDPEGPYGDRPFVLDAFGPARHEKIYESVPAWMAMLVDCRQTKTRIWLPTLADVLSVAAFPWSVDWAAAHVFRSLQDPERRAVALDHLQSEGKPLGEALAVWHAHVEDRLDGTDEDRLLAGIALFDAAAPVRELANRLAQSIDQDAIVHRSREAEANRPDIERRLALIRAGNFDDLPARIELPKVPSDETTRLRADLIGWGGVPPAPE